MKNIIITCLIVMLVLILGCKEPGTTPWEELCGETLLNTYYLDLIQFKKVNADCNHKIYDENNNELFYIDVVIEESFNKILNEPSFGKIDEYIESKEIKRLIVTEKHVEFFSKHDTFIMNGHFNNAIIYKEVIDGKEYKKEAWYLESFSLEDGTLLAIEDNKIICYKGEYTYFYGRNNKEMIKVKFREHMTKEEFLEFYINLYGYYNNGYC